MNRSAPAGHTPPDAAHRRPWPARAAQGAVARLAAATLAASLVACSSTLVQPRANALPSTLAPQAYPATRQAAQVDTYHGTAVADPYRWLEDDRSADTSAWVRAQNEVTERFLAAMPQRQPTRALFTRLYNFEKFGLPRREGGRYFWTRNNGLQPQSVVYTATTLDGPAQVALDPNTLSTDGTVALSGTAPSRNGQLLAYGVSVAGSDWQTWRVRDLATGTDLPDRLDWVKFSQASWTPDHQGFFYSRYDEPAAGTALSGVNQFHKLYYHRLGTAQQADVLVADNPAQKSWGFNAQVSDDGQRVVISVWPGGGRRNGLMVMPLAAGGALGNARPQPVVMAMDASHELVDVVGRRLVVKTDHGAPNGRLVEIDLDAPQPAAWRTLVPEGPDALSAASAVGGRYLLSYLHDAATLVRVHAADGTLLRELPLPGVGTASGFGGRPSEAETFFQYTSLTHPTELWRYDVASGQARLWRRPKTAMDVDRFETRRAFVTSRDGTRFPVFIAHRKGLVLDGKQPTLLYGYGGFRVSQTPQFSVTAATWMQMGGVYVLAALRGGGEYGAAWHAAGTLLQKQNVFDDFIAAAEWLIAQKITRPERLAINGGSNGGLLVGAVLNQRPELFGAAVPQVGVMDMLRFHQFTIGWAWVSDYGSSDDAEQFRALLAYSPLHTLRNGRRYPPVLVTTGDHDDRVVPAHSFKYAATLQAADTGPAPKLIRIETDAGHGAGKPTAKFIAERADVLAFIANAFGMAVAPP